MIFDANGCLDYCITDRDNRRDRSTPSLEDSMDFLLSEIVLLPLNFAPRGLAECAGQLLPIADNTALFSLIGNTFGGDGKTTFALPDYRGLAPKGSTYYIAIVGIIPPQ
jgi:microcystin-dependent protein